MSSKLGEDRRVEAAGAAARRDRGMAEAIVARALVGVGEHGVRLGRFLELLLGGLVARVAIGMVLERQLAIGALDVLVAGVARRRRAPRSSRACSRCLGHLAPAPAAAAGRRAGSPCAARRSPRRRARRRRLLVGDGLVQVRIEVCAERLDRRDAALAQQLGELAVDQLDAAAVAPAPRPARRRPARDRNRRPRPARRSARRRPPTRPDLAAFALDALAVVVELRASCAAAGRAARRARGLQRLERRRRPAPVAALGVRSRHRIGRVGRSTHDVHVGQARRVLRIQFVVASRTRATAFAALVHDVDRARVAHAGRPDDADGAACARPSR